LSISDSETTNETSPASKSFGDRKKGSTKKFLVEQRHKVRLAKEEIAKQYLKEKTIAQYKKQKVAPNYKKILIQQAVTKYDLNLKYFNEHTLHSWVMKKNPSGIAKHKVTPLAPIEPEIVKVVCQMGKVCNAMTK
jgi:hypothetical protein